MHPTFWPRVAESHPKSACFDSIFIVWPPRRKGGESGSGAEGGRGGRKRH